MKRISLRGFSEAEKKAIQKSGLETCCVWYKICRSMAIQTGRKPIACRKLRKVRSLCVRELGKEKRI